MPKIKRRTAGASKQELPQFEGIMHQATELYHRYRTIVISTLTALTVVVLMGGGYVLYQSGREQKASEMLSQAMAYYDPTTGGEPDFGRALDLFRRTGADYSGTMSGSIARYYAGNCLMQMGQTQDAVQEYQNFIKKPSGDSRLLGFVYQRLGYALLESGKRDDAIAAFQKAETVLGVGLATSELADLYEQAGRTEDARKKYTEIAEGLPGTMMADRARKKMGQASPPQEMPSVK